MNFARERIGGPLRLLSVAALALGSISIAVAADWPVFKPGQWRFERTMQGSEPVPQKVSTTECVDPTADQKAQRDMLAKAGCKFSPLAQSGRTYRYTADCKMGNMTSSSASVLEVDSPEAFTITVESTVDGSKSREVLRARRVGDCKP